jgi:uncharacterized pyridoxamine 5'-phosphate oxidase family protein
MSILSGLNAE